MGQRQSDQGGDLQGDGQQGILLRGLQGEPGRDLHVDATGTIGAFALPALIEVYRATGDKKYLDCAVRGFDFYARRDLDAFSLTAGAIDCASVDKETVWPLLRAALDLFDETGVVWQTGELGKVDEGGGGTVAKFIAKFNIDTVDIGVPVISMHSPWEVVSKADLYENYLAFKAFIK